METSFKMTYEQHKREYLAHTIDSNVGSNLIIVIRIGLFGRGFL